jgi:hypothetical protein
MVKLFVNVRNNVHDCVLILEYLGLAEKVRNASYARRQGEAVYEYCEPRATKQMMYFWLTKYMKDYLHKNLENRIQNLAFKWVQTVVKPLKTNQLSVFQQALVNDGFLSILPL